VLTTLDRLTDRADVYLLEEGGSNTYVDRQVVVGIISLHSNRME